MGIIEGRTWLEILSPPECYDLVRSAVVGRIAFLAGDHAEVMPVNYRVDGDDIVFRTDRGTKLDAALTQAKVTFQVDVVDLDAQSGWSVMAIGAAERISDPGELHHVDELGVEPWVQGAKAHWVRIRPSSITGRRIR